jgi:glycosyltransferase involved in cell wall biosynthesis
METPSHPWLKNKETPILLGVGRLTKAKNFPLLIKATSLVIKKTPVRLIILGEGSDQAKINKLIKKLGLQQIISMPGFVKNPYSYMRRSSVFVLSSLWEGFGNVIVEALATSTPVVSTDCPNGPREILENGKYGTLVPIGDPYKMANAILSTIRSSQKVTHLNIDKFESKHIAGLYISSINKLF